MPSRTSSLSVFSSYSDLANIWENPNTSRMTSFASKISVYGSAIAR